MKEIEKRTRQLTNIYITSIQNATVPEEAIVSLRDVLISFQGMLSATEKKEYEEWHLKKWPNLDW